MCLLFLQLEIIYKLFVPGFRCIACNKRRQQIWRITSRLRRLF